MTPPRPEQPATAAGRALLADLTMGYDPVKGNETGDVVMPAVYEGMTKDILAIEAEAREQAMLDAFDDVQKADRSEQEQLEAECRCLPITPGGPCGCRCHGIPDEPSGDLVAIEARAAFATPAPKEAVRERLRAAEDVCLMFGWSASHSKGPREKATLELWRRWVDIVGTGFLEPRRHPDLSDTLAALRQQPNEAEHD